VGFAFSGIVIFICLVIFISLVTFFSNSTTSSTQDNQTQIDNRNVGDPKEKEFLSGLNKVETKEQYIASTKSILGTQSKKGIYYKEYLKNPLKFKGARLYIIGKIFQIEETEGKSALQIYITHEFDSIIVYYKGNTNLYKDDFVKIYGEGGELFEGKNAFGAIITVPIINAKYLKKVNLNE
ncbi:MAG: hypothetical protein ABSC11_08905, partial [Smithella sp.]